jgi:hypothetical protein
MTDEKENRTVPGEEKIDLSPAFFTQRRKGSKGRKN